MKQRARLVNYLLSITLILLVIVFVILLMSISRLVLSDYNPVSEHLVTTQNMLTDIEDVKDAAIDPSKVQLGEKDLLELSYEGLDISDISYLNVNETRAIVTMFINAPVGSVGESIYYVKINDTRSLDVGELVTYEMEGIRIGNFVSLGDRGELIVVDSVDQKVVEVEASSVLGRVFYSESQR